jgi:hypothetical protein
MDTELVMEMTVLLTDSLSTADWKTFLRLNNIMADGRQQNDCDKQPGAMRKIDGITTTFSSFCNAFCHQETFITLY